MQIKSVPLTRVKAGPDDGLNEGEFIVYPSTFTKTPDSYGDIVKPGAFKNTLKAWKESGNVLPGLFGHRFDDPDFYVASATDYGEDEHGWWVKGEFDLESPKGPHVYRLVKGRRLNQLSFAFDVLDSGPVKLEDGSKANELRELHVHEFSFVPIGANSDTSVVAVKSLTEALTHDVKAGRVLASKHITSLRKAQEAISAVIAAASGDDDQEEKASGSAGDEPGSKDEASNGKSSVNGEELKQGPSVKNLAAKFNIYSAAYGGERGSL